MQHHGDLVLEALVLIVIHCHQPVQQYSHVSKAEHGCERLEHQSSSYHYNMADSQLAVDNCRTAPSAAGYTATSCFLSGQTRSSSDW
jgi:hypothetical protein